MDTEVKAPDKEGTARGGRAPDAGTMQALQDLRQCLARPRTEERRATNRELLDEVLNARTPAQRSRAADALRRQIRSLCAAVIDQQASALTAQEVEDLTQEVMLRLLQSRTVQAVDPTPAYLARIATNVLIDHLRAVKRRGLTAPAARSEDEDEMARVADPRLSVEEEVLGRVQSDQIRATLSRALKPLEADVLWLRAEGASHRDVALELGIKEANARKHFERGVKRLKQLATAGQLSIPL